MSGVGGAVSGYSQMKAAEEASDTNRKNAEAQRALETQFFRESRGATGSAVLPTYAGDFERALFAGAQGSYEANRAALGSPSEELARYQADVARFNPAIEGGNRVVDSIYSGDMQQERLAQAQPVMEARTNLAKTQKQGILDDITARLGALDAANARKGFVGTGSAAQGAALRQTAPMYQRAAGVGAQASLENAMQTQGIYDTNRDLQLRSLDIPATRAQQLVGLRQLPFQTAAQNELTAQKPFGMFNIGNYAFRPDALPQVQPIPSALAIGATAAGSSANQVMQYLADQRRASQYRGAQTNYSQPAYNPYAAGATNYDAAAAYGVGGGGAAWGGTYGETAGAGAFDY